MFAATSVWNWVESTTPELQNNNVVVPTSQQQQHRTPTPPAGGKSSSSAVNNNNRNVVITAAAAKSQNDNNDVSEFWRKQMQIIVRLSKELEKEDQESEQKKEVKNNNSNVPRWVTAVVQALKCCKIGGVDEEDCAAAFWDIAASDGNIIAGVEYARLILFSKNENILHAEATVKQQQQQKALRYLDSACSAQIPSAMHLVAKLLLMFDTNAPPPQQQQLSSGNTNNNVESSSSSLLAFNPSLAKRWLERAASLEYAPAIHEMGELYYSSTTSVAASITTQFPQNIVVAMRCFKKSAELGFAESYFNLGKLFLLSLQDDDSEDKQKEKISRAQYFLNQYVSRVNNKSSTNYDEAIQLLENCAMKS
jgi:TPR repeat protein